MRSLPRFYVFQALIFVLSFSVYAFQTIYCNKGNRNYFDGQGYDDQLERAVCTSRFCYHLRTKFPNSSHQFHRFGCGNEPAIGREVFCKGVTKNGQSLAKRLYKNASLATLTCCKGEMCVDPKKEKIKCYEGFRDYHKKSGWNQILKLVDCNASMCYHLYGHFEDDRIVESFGCGSERYKPGKGLEEAKRCEKVVRNDDVLTTRMLGSNATKLRSFECCGLDLCNTPRPVTKCYSGYRNYDKEGQMEEKIGVVDCNTPLCYQLHSEFKNGQWNTTFGCGGNTYKANETKYTICKKAVEMKDKSGGKLARRMLQDSEGLIHASLECCQLEMCNVPLMLLKAAEKEGEDEEDAATTTTTSDGGELSFLSSVAAIGIAFVFY